MATKECRGASYVADFHCTCDILADAEASDCKMCCPQQAHCVKSDTRQRQAEHIMPAVALVHRMAHGVAVLPWFLLLKVSARKSSVVTLLPAYEAAGLTCSHNTTRCAAHGERVFLVTSSIPGDQAVDAKVRQCDWQPTA